MDIYNSNGFDYIEGIENIDQLNFPDTLRLNETPTSEALLFRLLLGSLSLKANGTEAIIEQKIFYGQLKETFENHDFDNPIHFWASPEFGLIDLDYYFKKNRGNKLLFDELLTEFSLFFIQKNRNNHTSAFLHLYRGLEYMSYSFPISFASRTHRYFTSFDTFKSFFVNKDDGQLKFFREFIKSLFEKRFLETKLKIDTYVGEDFFDKRKLSIIKKLCSDFKYWNNGAIVEIEYLYLLDFMITLRNRYFHFQYDRSDNISNLHFDSESFFESLNDKFANWLALIYLEIMTQGIYKLNLLPISA